MFLNEQIKYCENNVAKSVSFEQLSNIIEYITELETEAKKDFLASAEKSVMQLDYRVEALVKKGIHIGYVDILERFKKIVRG